MVAPDILVVELATKSFIRFTITVEETTLLDLHPGQKPYMVGQHLFPAEFDIVHIPILVHVTVDIGGLIHQVFGSKV